jgi:hypothetical protein
VVAVARMRARGGACGGDGVAAESWRVGETARKTMVDERKTRSNRLVKKGEIRFLRDDRTRWSNDRTRWRQHPVTF